jgi:hypothetical protein
MSREGGQIGGAYLAREYEVGEVTIWRAIKAPFEANAAA